MTGRFGRSSWRVPGILAVLLVAIVGSFLVAQPPAEAANESSSTGFTVVRVPGVFSGQANAIAPNGIVVGTGTLTEGGFGSGNDAWIWRGGGTGDAERINPNFGAQGGIFFAEADDVNSAGQVVGTYDFPGVTTDRAFRWNSADGLTTFGPGPGIGGVTNGVGISESGEIVGYRTVPTGSFRGSFGDDPVDFEVVDSFRATSIEGGTVAGLFNTWSGSGLTPLDSGTATVGIANAIAGSGELAGYLLTSGSPNQAAMWPSPTGEPSLLGSLGGTTSVAHGINSVGVVVGGAETAGGDTHAFVWTAADGMRDLGTLGGSYSEAFDVNGSGLIVGAASDADGFTRAVVWDLNGTFDPDLPPVIDVDLLQDAYEGETLTIAPAVSDPDGDAWTVTWQEHGLEFADTGPFLEPLETVFELGATQVGDDLVWTPGVGTEAGNYVVRVTATQDDDPGNSSSRIVFIQFPGQNRPPVIDPITDQTAAVDALFEVDADATDPDGDTFTFGFLFGTLEAPLPSPAGASIDPATGIFSWTPAAADLGVHTVTIGATDTGFFTGYETFQVEVTDDDPPTTVDVIVSEAITVADDVTITLGASPLTILVAETIEVTDTATVAGPLLIEVNEQIEVTDDVAVTGPLTIVVTEQVNVLDDVRISGPLVIEVNESIAVSDDVGVTGPLLIVVAEQVDVSDVVQVTGPLTILVTERVDVSDTITVQAGDDGDGIDAPIDGTFEGGVFTSEADTFSDGFTDQGLGGVTFGTVTDRAGQDLGIADAPDAVDGLRVTTGSAPGSVVLELCSAPSEMTVAPDTALTFLCGSITVSVEVGSVSVAVSDGTLLIPAGATVTIDELAGPSISTAPESTATPVLTIDGLDIPVPPGTTYALVHGCIGDVNGDGAINVGDFQAVARALFSRPGQRRWNPAADLNGDDRIDGRDLQIVSNAINDPNCQGDPPPPPPACDGDVNGDGRVTSADVDRVFAAFWSRPGDPRWDPAADLNDDGRVNGQDLRIVLNSLADPACR